MEQILEGVWVHPKGERQKALDGDKKSWPVDTPGGRYYAEWDTEAPVTREGQLIFFFQFLHRACPGTRERGDERSCWVKKIGHEQRKWLPCPKSSGYNFVAKQKLSHR